MRLLGSVLWRRELGEQDGAAGMQSPLEPSLSLVHRGLCKGLCASDHDLTLFSQGGQALNP